MQDGSRTGKQIKAQASPGFPVLISLQYKDSHKKKVFTRPGRNSFSIQPYLMKKQKSADPAQEWWHIEPGAGKY
jgi:hypothetical protein